MVSWLGERNKHSAPCLDPGKGNLVPDATAEMVIACLGQDLWSGSADLHLHITD